jgi:hypothetical protein
MKIQNIVLIFSLALFSCKEQKKLPPPPPLTKQEVIDAIMKFDDGWRTKNKAAVDSMLGPSYIYFTQSGGLFTRDSVVATSGSPDYSLERMTRMEYQVELQGNTAIVATRWMGKGIYRGKPFNEDQRCSITLIKTGNRIQIYSEHCTPIRPGSIFH